MSVSNRTANSFEVHELGGGTANLSFGYRIMALRRSYENVRFADHTHDIDAVNRALLRQKAGVARPQSRYPSKKLPTLPANAQASFKNNNSGALSSGVAR